MKKPVPEKVRQWLYTQRQYLLLEERFQVENPFDLTGCIQDGGFLELPAPTKGELVPTWDHRRDGAE